MKEISFTGMRNTHMREYRMQAFAIPAPLDVRLFVCMPHYRQSSMLRINGITLSALLASCTVTRDFTSVRVQYRTLYFFRLDKHSRTANPLSFPSLKHYIELYRASHSSVFFFPFEPIELHYRLISNRSLPSFSLGLAPTMTL